MRRRFLVLCALIGSASAARASDSELPLDLTWEAPPECASTAQIRAELARIARVRPGRTVARLAAVGRIDSTAGSYRLTLHTEREGVAGERSLTSTECRSLEREVTLVLALAFGEGVEIVEPPPENAAPAPKSAEPAPKSAEPLAAAPAEKAPNPRTAEERPEPVRHDEVRPEDRATRFHVAPFVGAGVLFGILPSPTPFAVVGTRLGMRHFWAEPRLVWIPGEDDALPRGVLATYDGLGGALSACASLPPYPWSLDACLGIDVWALRGHSTGASQSGSAVAPFIAGVATLGWLWPPHGGIRFGAEAELHVAFGEPRFVVEGLGEVHRVERVAPGLAAKVVFVPGG